MTDNLPPLPDFGPIHTEPSGKVEMYPAAFRECLRDVWKKGARAALAQAQSCVPAVPDEFRELLREARDNCQASIAESGISRVRAEYRQELFERLSAALAASPQPQPVQPSEPVIHQHGFARANGYLQTINESLDKQLEEVMAERDDRDDVLSDIAHLIDAEFTSEYGFRELIADLEERLTIAQAKPEQAAQPFLNCTCFNETDRMYCTSKGKCSRIVAAAAPQPKD